MRVKSHKYLFLFVTLVVLIGNYGYKATAQSLNQTDTSKAAAAINKSAVTDRDTTVKGWKAVFFPAFFYTNETKLAGGLGVQLVKKGSVKRYSSAVRLLAYYTQNNQYEISSKSESFYKDGQYKLLGELIYQYYPDKFYGLGNFTNKEDEEIYTARLFRFNPTIQQQVFPNVFAGIHFDFFYYEMVETMLGKMLDSGIVPGSDGGLSSGTGIHVGWDTRDNNLYPTSGSFNQLTAVFYGTTLGGDFTFNTYTADIRKYILVFPRQVLALRAVINSNSGDPPFQMLYYTGSLGNILRGYTQSRFMDKHAVAVDAEYRMPLFWRFGMVVFAGIGQVAPKLNQLAVNDLKPCFGIGGRFTLIPKENVNIRVDIGIGKDDSSLNLNLMEAF